MLVHFGDVLDKLIVGMYSTIEEIYAMLFINKSFLISDWLQENLRLLIKNEKK